MLNVREKRWLSAHQAQLWAALAIALVLTGAWITLYVRYPGDWIDPVTWWMEAGPSGQAGWMQAIGSILAIIAALGIGIYQARQNRHLVARQMMENRKLVLDERKRLATERDHQEQLMALLIGMRLFNTSREAKGICVAWESWKKFAAKDVITEAEMQIAKGLSSGLRFSNSLGDLGADASLIRLPQNVAVKVVSAVESLTHYDRTVSYLIDLIYQHGVDPEVRTNAIDSRIAVLGNISEKCLSAYDAIAQRYGLMPRDKIETDPTRPPAAPSDESV